MATPVLRRRKTLFVLASLLAFSSAKAESLVPPGDLQLLHDLMLLNDRGVINVPMTTWPLAFADIRKSLQTVDTHSLVDHERAALERLQSTFLSADSGLKLSVNVAAALEPRFVRTFEDTPREEGELGLRATWQRDRISAQLSVSRIANPFDGDEVVPDGTHIALGLGNWILAAGWIDRWYGPGRDGSLILGTNARPPPGISLQRSVSRPFRNRWLSWVGPWSLSVFMSELDDDRVIDDAWLFGVRGSARPLPGLEIGISRTAQWCGTGRPCDLPTFGDLLVGNDNRGVNVTPEDEPGNQLGGFDVRWSLPRNIPVALYMQWIGEDGRGGGGAIGSWLRQIGVEWWGDIRGTSHRTHLEISDSTCHEGGFGFSGSKPDCAYEHGVYRTGYRYQGRSIGHGSDGDSLSYSIGSTLVQSAGHTWNATLRYMEINREGQPTSRHTLSSTPEERFDFQLTHKRRTRAGTVFLGIQYRHSDSPGVTGMASGVAGFVQWSSR